MKHRHISSFVLASLLFLAPVVPIARAATGFVDSPLLLSPENPKDGDTVTLSVLFHNAEPTTISGTVLFYDTTTLLDKKSLSIAPGDVGIASTSFVIHAGIHKFSATMSNVDAPNSSGTLEAVVIPETTVTLPPEIITRSLGLGAQAADGSNDSEAAILNTVDAAQTAVLNAVPPNIKAAVSGTTGSLDSWRVSTGSSFTSDRDATKASITAANKIDAENAAKKPGAKAVAKPATADNSAVSQAKYYFFAALAFFFSMPFAFYLGSVLLLYLILRFIFRRLRRSRRGNSAPKPQK